MYNFLHIEHNLSNFTFPFCIYFWKLVFLSNAYKANHALQLVLEDSLFEVLQLVLEDSLFEMLQLVLEHSLFILFFHEIPNCLDAKTTWHYTNMT